MKRSFAACLIFMLLMTLCSVTITSAQRHPPTSVETPLALEEAETALASAGTVRGVVPDPVDVTAITGQEVAGPLTSWQTQDGRFTVEHLAGRSPGGDLLTFFWSPRANWQVVNVSAITGQQVVGPLTSWQTQDGRFTVEHLAGRSPGGDLLTFFWSPRANWQVVNVSAITGQQVAGPLTSWQTQDGRFTVEHLAGRSPGGDLLTFFWSPRANWQVVNVSAITGQQVAGPLTSWQTQDGRFTVEHLAGRSPHGDLLTFFWSPRANWQVVNVSAITGQQVAGPLTSWQTPEGSHIVEHLAGTGPDKKLYVFWWTPSTDWRVVDVTRIAGGGKVANGAPAVYQLRDGAENVEILGVRSRSGALLQYWWKPSRDWQRVNLSEITGRTIAADPTGWLTSDGGNVAEHFAAPDPSRHLLVFWGYSQPRLLTDKLGERFQALKRVRTPRKVVAILWDWRSPADAALPQQTIASTLFGAKNSVRDYFLENSDDYFTIESAAVLGWYRADRPFTYYACPSKGYKTSDPDGGYFASIGCPPKGFARAPGWSGGHVEKWAEAIRKADTDFNFAAYDNNRDGVLTPDELGIVIVIPANNPNGFTRRAVGRQIPEQPLIVDGVRLGTNAGGNNISELYIGNPPNIGLAAHELSHLLLEAADMYFNLPDKPRWKNIPFDNPFAAGDYSLMDRTTKTTHLDPLHKLKLGWVRPKIIFRGGRYSLRGVEEGHEVWILLDPARGAREYFIIENRWPGNSYDQQMADGGGLAVWHIMENPDVYGSRIPPTPPNAPPGSRQDLWKEKWKTIDSRDWGRRAIWMIRPFWSTANDSKALWDGADPATGYDLISAANPPLASLRWADGTPSGFAIRSISAAGSRMQATIEVPGAP